jgi:glycosyltransferase involved in cell wall biosynthesis
MEQIDISVVIPFFNEQDSLNELFDALIRVLSGVGKRYEIVLIDDGSTDNSADVAKRLSTAHPEARLIRLRGNQGKTAALKAGFDHSRGQIVFTMDADLQDDPKEIPRFIEAIDQGCDLVSGYKKKRFDPMLKRWSSRLYNGLMRAITGLQIHDINCGFKAYRRRVVDELWLYGEMHRLTPLIAHWKNFKVGEITVEHHCRRYGVSKYHSNRIFRGLMDLLTLSFLMRFYQSPSHQFGKIGFISFLLGFFICLYLTILWFLDLGPIGNRPLLFLGILLIILGIQFFGFGLLAELQTFNALKDDKPYIISEIIDG